MSFTTDNLTKIQDAMIALAAGERVVRITVKGKTMEYGVADLPQLTALRDKIKSEPNKNSRKRFTRIQTRKGL